MCVHLAYKILYIFHNLEVLKGNYLRYSGLLINGFNIYVDILYKSRNLEVTSLKREFGERYDKAIS